MSLQYNNYREFPAEMWKWPNFSPVEMACPHCEGLLIVPRVMDRLQAVRYIYGHSIIIASAYRCKEHNTAIGGGENSAHMRGTAVDAYPGRGGDLAGLLDAFNTVGWLGHGMGAGKLHFDWDHELGKRAWYYGE